MDNNKQLIEGINLLSEVAYDNSFKAGWHTNIETGELKERNKAEMICLMHSELSEAMEGERKDLMDTHLPHRKMVGVELADLLIRVGDYAGRWGYNLGEAVVEKMYYNKTRADHSIENRLKDNGKKF